MKPIAGYCGNETVVRENAVRCFGSAAAATVGIGIAVTGAARKRGGSSAVQPTGDINRVAKDD